MADDELRDWQDLIESPGWMRFVEHIAAEWGKDEGNGAAFRQAVRQVADQSDANAMAQLRQVLSAQAAVQKIMRVPEARIADLKRFNKATNYEAVMGRRGAL